MPAIQTSALSFERGIDSISHVSRDNDHEPWPDRQSLSPASSSVKAHLTELLAPPDTTRYLNTMLQPTVSNPALLTPATYHATLSKALQSLRTAASSTNEHSRPLSRAARLLTEELGLRDLAQMYRSALYQG